MDETRIRRVSRKLFRGPQPELEDLRHLQRRGLKQVVNLRLESEHSRTLCAELGLEYCHLPVPDRNLPGLEQLEEFYAAVRDISPALVHCWGGSGRTGVFVSCYRIARLGWDAQAALDRSETEAYEDGLSSLQRRFVLDYERELRDR